MSVHDVVVLVEGSLLVVAIPMYFYLLRKCYPKKARSQTSEAQGDDLLPAILPKANEPFINSRHRVEDDEVSVDRTDEE